MKSILEKVLKHIRTVKYRWWVLAHDLAMVPLAWMMAYWLRYNLSHIPKEFMHEAVLMIPIVLVVQGTTLVFFGVHRGVWRFTSLPDLIRVLKAVVVGTTLVALAIFLYTRLEYVPRSVFFMYGIVLAVFLCGSRISYRLLKERHFSTRIEKKALVVGAGAAGEQVVRDLLRNSPRSYDPVAFVDDDPSKIGKDIHGVRVAADCSAIAHLCERWSIDLILIAVPSATDKQMQRLVAFCEASGVEYRTLPAIHDIVSGHVGVSDLRRVHIEDLLGRDPVRLDWRGIANALRGKRVLVTGGGGSIGSEMCRQLASIGPAELILYEQSEFNLYTVERELRAAFPDLKLTVVLGDICDGVAVDRLFARTRPEVIYHAAAYKHVPMLEGQIREAIKNNVLGSIRVANAAGEHGSETFVLISTDKAVNPTSLMGACKRVAEIYCQALNSRSNTRYVTVRFGNVLGSAGSVVPLFRQQIEAGGPVTVTDPDVTRYFMTPAEATQLIVEASTVGQGGEIYVLDMGEPIKVAFLAEQMIKLYGKTPGEDIEVVYTGLRPGEKLKEELFYPEENAVKTKHEKILLANTRQLKWPFVADTVDQIERAVNAYDEPMLLSLLAKLVPELRTNHLNAGGRDDDVLEVANSQA